MMADIVGFSASTGRDDEGTLRRVRAIEREIVRPKTIEHHGRVVKTLGDGFLCEFASVVEAFRCAITIQETMRGHHHESDDSSPMEMRIGIDFGDIIIDDNDVFGDGVNIAARIEQLAQPGGICVSHRAREQLRRFEVDFEDIGEQRLKNIAGAVRVYRVNNAGGPAPNSVILLYRWLRNRKRLVGVVALLVLIAAGGLFYLTREPPTDAEQFVRNEIENRDCAWLRVSEFDPGAGDEGATAALSGASSAPPALVQSLMQAAAAQGVNLRRVEVRDVYPVAADQCTWIVQLGRYRYTGIPRLVSGDAAAIDDDGTMSFTISFDPEELADHVQLFSIDPNGEMVAIPGGDRAALTGENLTAAQRQRSNIRTLGDGTIEREIFSNHTGWGGFMIMESDAPIDSGLVLAAQETQQDIAAFDARAERDNWRFELLWLNAENGADGG